MQATKEELVGFFAGAAITVPWLGRITGLPLGLILPSSAIALLFLPVTFIALLGLGRENIQIKRPMLTMLLLIGLYLLFVMQSASYDQVRFFVTTSEWMESEKHYFAAKLLKFSLSFVPALIAGSCVAMIRDRERVLNGLCAAIVAAGVVAALNVTRYGGILFATDYETASAYFPNTYDADLPSLVSYGFLFCIAVVASITMGRLWFLGGIFIFMLFLLGRRTEFILSLISILGFILWGYINDRSNFLSNISKIAVILVTAGVLSAILSNEISVQRWAGLWYSVKERVDILLVVTEREPVAPGSGGSGAGGQGSESAAPGASEPEANGTPNPSEGYTIGALLFGYGLGWYSELGAANEYPHNALVEAWFENGAIAALLLGCIYTYSIILSFRAATRQLSGLATFLMIACLITASMKAGDIASSARLFSFMLISTSFGAALQRAGRDMTRGNKALGQSLQG